MSVYRIERLAEHERGSFSSGSEPLDRYLKTQASQDMRRHIANCFVAVAGADEVAGFYSLSATSLLFDQLPPEKAKRLPRYPTVPAALLGRLAVDLRHRGVGLGAALVADAIQRALASDVAGRFIVADAKDEEARRFYERLDFKRLHSDGFRLVRNVAP